MSEQTLHLLSALRQRLVATGRRLTLAEVAFGVALTGGAFALLWLVSAAVEAGFWLSTAPRSVLLGLVLLTTLCFAGYFLVLPLLRLWNILPGHSDTIVAARIGTKYPEVSDRLISLLDLAEGRRSEAPPHMVDGAVRMLEAQVSPVPFEQVEDFNQARRVGRLAGIPVAGLLVFLLAAPGTFLGASARLLSPATAFERPAPFALQVEPGTYELVRGEPLEIQVHTQGRQLPRSMRLYLNNRGEDLVEEIVLSPDSSGTFRHTVVNVRQPLRYRVTADPVESRWYNVTVSERPLVRSLQVSLDFPSYTGIPAQRLEANVGDVTALAGTRIRIEIAVGGRDVQEAVIRFDDGSQGTLALQGATAAGSFSLARNGTYQVVLRNKDGAENGNPITYSLKALNDAPPTVVLVSPAQEAALTEALQADLNAHINDDFGFSRVELHYRLAESRYGSPNETFTAIPLPLTNPRQIDQEFPYRWLLGQTTDLDPVPGDVIEYYVQVWDNDAVAGYKSSRSSMHRLRVPSLVEQYSELEEGQDQAATEIQDLLQDAENVREQFEELRDQLRSKQEAEWEDTRQIERLQEQQRSLETRVESLSEQVESMTQQMQENSLVSDETLQDYQELQKVMEEINSPELQEALQQLQEAMQQLDLQQLQESIGNFEFNEQQFRERLERTLELFQKLRVQQGMEEAARRTEELARQQEELAQKTEELRNEQQSGTQEPESRRNEEPKGQQDERQNGQQQGEQNQQQRTEQSEQTREQLAQEQERSSEEMKALEEQIRQMHEQMEQMRSAPKEQMEQLDQKLQQQQIPQQMQQNSEQLRQNQLAPAQQSQEQMQQQLQQLQQQMQQMQQGMQGQQGQVNMAGLRRALNDVLTLSEQQENLRETVRSTSAGSPVLRELTQQQVRLSEGLSVVSDSLQRLSRSIPQMSREVQLETGNALREMASATGAMSESQTALANGHQQGSMMHLNELALLLSDLMNQLMNSQSGSGGGMSMQQMLEQMQQMAGQQQQLNDQIQQMLNDTQGERLSSSMQQRLQQMAGQQEAIRRQLKDLARDPNSRGKLLGDLNKIAEQMQESIEELQSAQTDRQTIERQQQILTRLLDAQKSMQERGRERQRQSQSGTTPGRQSPSELTPDEQVEKLREDLIRALESGYTPDYQELIRRYFELLQNQAQPQEQE